MQGVNTMPTETKHFTDIGTCPLCGGEIAIRNPKGNCDRLYYPENCPVCFDRVNRIKSKGSQVRATLEKHSPRAPLFLEKSLYSLLVQWQQYGCLHYPGCPHCVMSADRAKVLRADTLRILRDYKEAVDNMKKIMESEG
jgi:ssDNA-binding Zn-finger/Zn-ribbon topoisomerase 1